MNTFMKSSLPFGSIPKATGYAILLFCVEYVLLLLIEPSRSWYAVFGIIAILLPPLLYVLIISNVSRVIGVIFSKALRLAMLHALCLLGIFVLLISLLTLSITDGFRILIVPPYIGAPVFFGGFILGFESLDSPFVFIQFIQKLIVMTLSLLLVGLVVYFVLGLISGLLG